MPSFATLYEGRPTSSLPRKRMEPVTRAGGMPTIALQSVVLPMPLRPMIDVAPPAISKETSSSACSDSAIAPVPAAEIEVVHRLVGTDLVGRALDDHPAVVHHRHALGDPERDVHVVLDQDQ